ncbi:MAG: group II intron reverse transcriptase domain-containing protein [Candidatus Pacebacteria bacterium]|jgi:retron-type reverse transcriptase|nr:group II intron reverse transcriptase domain-containing protein [Candidatus Paceibacterota bacterium]
MYDSITSLENLYASWREFQNGKRYKNDVAVFSRNLDVHIYNLHQELKGKSYAHSAYEAFKINDPKPRDIHKALVRDRLLHHAIYRVLYPFFDAKFIYDSYSCRMGKGTHKAMERFRVFSRKVSRNNTRTCHILKCDIRKFFASIDHDILKQILAKHVNDRDTLALLGNIIDSFNTEGRKNIGLPLGNLTSQLLVNVYMNKFDQFVKHTLKAKYYIRYADDFVFLSEDKIYLETLISIISDFLESRLKLALHPDKVYIKTLASGVDFLGWVHFPHHRVLRTATKRRMMRNLAKNGHKEETVQSYVGMLGHGNAHKIIRDITDATYSK